MSGAEAMAARAVPDVRRRTAVCAVGVAAIYVLWVAVVHNEPISDQCVYYDQAARLHQGLGYVDENGRPTAYWAPGYSFYLAGVFQLLGEGFRSAFVGNLAAATAMIAGIYALGRNLYGARAAATAAFLSAAYPSFVFYSTVIASEVLFTALVAWALLLMAKSATERRWLPWTALAGVVLGAASFTRPQAMILGFAMLGWHGPVRTRALQALVITAFLFMSLLPWRLRNERELGGAVWVSTNAGPNLWIGNHPGASGDYEDFDQITHGQDLAHKSLIERDVHLQHVAQQFIASHPFQYLVLCGKRIWITFRSESGGVVWNEVGLTKLFGSGSLVYFKVLTNTAYFGVCAFVGYSLLRRRRSGDAAPSDRFLLFVVLLLALPSVLILGASRFHLPIIPFAILFASSRWGAATPPRGSTAPAAC